MLRQQVLYAEIKAGEMQHLRECGSAVHPDKVKIAGRASWFRDESPEGMMEERSTGGRTVVELKSFEDNNGFFEDDILLQTGIISGCERRALALKAWPMNQGSVE